VDVPKAHGYYRGINITPVVERAFEKITTTMPTRPSEATSAPHSSPTEKVETVPMLSCQFSIGSTATWITRIVKQAKVDGGLENDA